ncbi:MAG: isoleucine--tRNA ligase [Thermoplasmata archaeon]
MCGKVFREVKTKKHPELEKEILAFWESEGIEKKVREKMKSGKIFVFCEGPPTANGQPHIGHVLTRTSKDAFLRYKVMNGYEIFPYKAGWDCHGLPVEIEVEKELKISGKKKILEVGIDKFNKLCKQSVFKYKSLWELMSKRMAYWLDYENPYITMDDNYIESVWWSLKELWKKNLLEKSYYIVPYCPRCGTPLSSHEVAQGYDTARDPSIYVKFKVANEDAYFLVWTTTPWTLLSNLLLAVHPDVDYVLAEKDGERYYIGEKLASSVLGEHEVIKKLKGRDLVGKRYEPLFPYGKKLGNVHYVAAGDFVGTEEGTSIVHIAPAYGLDDYELCKKENVPLLNLVDENGKFMEGVENYAGMFVKDADKHIIQELKERGILYKAGTIEHIYPFCWRCDSPLLYYALNTWFIRTSRVKERLIANNEMINWIPEHLKHGRFGNFLEEIKDWALSRNRFWGTPLPIWQCKCGNEICIGSKEELMRLSVEPLSPDFELHRPFVDTVKIKCERCGEIMKREEYVIDGWYDSGCAPFAQLHYPFENKELFEERRPVEFISEALDQTRGWFYTLHAISTLLFDMPAYKNVVCLGLILDDKGQKMSKSKGNAVEPISAFDKLGADVIRFYFYLTPLWNTSRFSEAMVNATSSKMFNTLMNVYSFFVSNANVDGFVPHGIHPHDLLDIWLISRLNSTIKIVRDGFETYNLHISARAIESLVYDISNWYLRRSRRRFWEDTPSKIEGYETLYTTLVTLAKLLAPLAPFASEEIYQNLVRSVRPDAPESVHLTEFPLVDENAIRIEVEKAMKRIIELAELGRNMRQSRGVKLRQPLCEMYVECEEKLANELAQYLQYLADELNVKCVHLNKPLPSGEDYVFAETEGIKLVLNMRIDEQLRYEGLAREVVRRIQSMRKNLNLEYTQKIETGFSGDQEIEAAIEKFREYIMRETLSEKLEKGLEKGKSEKWKIYDMELTIWVNPL